MAVEPHMGTQVFVAPAGCEVEGSRLHPLAVLPLSALFVCCLTQLGLSSLLTLIPAPAAVDHTCCLAPPSSPHPCPVTSNLFCRCIWSRGGVGLPSMQSGVAPKLYTVWLHVNPKAVLISRYWLLRYGLIHDSFYGNSSFGGRVRHTRYKNGFKTCNCWYGEVCRKDMLI